MLGWVAATGDFGIEHYFFNSIFGNSLIFGQLVGSYMKIMKSGFYVANRQKTKYRFAGYFVYGWLIIASLLPCLGYTGRLFISPVAAVVIFLLGVWMLFYAVKL
jgi:protoheme IX farnesyltransferase